jgi:YHS domain-containing protein
MLSRLLFWIGVILGLYWLLRRMLRASAGGARAARTVRSAGQMVRDRVCETFLPESSALRLSGAGGTHYFCSAACRDRFLARSGRG